MTNSERMKQMNSKRRRWSTEDWDLRRNESLTLQANESNEAIRQKLDGLMDSLSEGKTNRDCTAEWRSWMILRRG